MPDDLQQDMQRGNGGQRPVPDPTVLTTEALQREVGGLEELVKRDIAALRDSFNKDLEGKFAVLAEKLASVEQQLAQNERQRVEQKTDTKAAVDAALIAQKEAVKEQTTASERAIAKSEAATTKSIEQLGSTFTTAFDGQRRDIDDLKERVGGAEGQATGVRSAHTQSSVSTGQIVAIMAAVVGVLGLIILIANVATGV